MSLRRRQRTTASPLSRALSAACFAGATALSAAFLKPGCGAGFHAVNNNANAAAGVRSVGGPTLRTNRVLVASALADAPAPLPTTAGAATTSGRRRRQGKPPLTVDEERALLARIQEARVLTALQESLSEAKGGGAVTGGEWAREAGLEVEELKRALEGGIEAKRTLVERNMPMVMHLIEQQYRWRLQGGQVSTADLLQEGAYALGLAADRFDPKMPNRFLTYALYLVRDKMDTALASGNAAVSVPAAALKELYLARRNLTDRLGRQPSEEEFASFFLGAVASDAERPATGGGRRKGAKDAAAPDRAELQPRIRARRVNLLSAVQKVRSVDALVRGGASGGTVALVDTLVGHNGDPLLIPGNGDMSELLPKVLTPKQAALVRMACGLSDGPPLSMAECSKRLSLSVGRTKALFESSLEKLRIAATADNPRLVVYKETAVR